MPTSRDGASGPSTQGLKVGLHTRAECTKTHPMGMHTAAPPTPSSLSTSQLFPYNDSVPALSNTRKRSASGSTSKTDRSDDLDGPSEKAHNHTKRHCWCYESAPASDVSTAENSSDVSIDLERAAQTERFLNEDLEFYHPQYSSHIPLLQRRSWPLVEAGYQSLQRYPENLEALDMAIAGLSPDSGIDMQECNVSQSIEMAYIGAWSS